MERGQLCKFVPLQGGGTHLDVFKIADFENYPYFYGWEAFKSIHGNNIRIIIFLEYVELIRAWHDTDCNLEDKVIYPADKCLIITDVSTFRGYVLEGQLKSS